LLVLGEECITDEIQLAQALPRLSAEGPRLILAIDPRWSDLARRSFPGVSVVPLLHRRRRGLRQCTAALDAPHLHEGRPVDAWTTLRSIVAQRRSDIADFADAQAYLKPDADRVARWSDWLRSLGPGAKAGVVWRELGLDAHAMRDLRAVPGLPAALRQPGVQLVSLQAAAAAGEVDALREALDIELHEPPGLDPGAHFDDLAALACALDVVIGPRCAATAIAAACGAGTWFLAPSRSWPMLGTGGYPWHPQAQVFSAATLDDWTAVMARVGSALAKLGEP
jgi:hypothetical protein